MVQIVYVLEVRQPTGYARVHFAQTLGAAQRAAARHQPGGTWQPEAHDPRVRSRLLRGGKRSRASYGKPSSTTERTRRQDPSCPRAPSAIWRRAPGTAPVKLTSPMTCGALVIRNRR